MKHYYKLTITKTARPMGNNTNWQIYDNEVKEFNTPQEVKKYLKSEYFYTKTIKPSYRDGKNNEPVRSGYIYCFKSDPSSYDDCKHYEQHWVNVYKIASTPILL